MTAADRSGIALVGLVIAGLAVISYISLMYLLDRAPPPVESGELSIDERNVCAVVVQMDRTGEVPAALRYDDIKPEKLFATANAKWNGKQYSEAIPMYRCLASVRGVIESYRDVSRLRVGIAYFSGLSVDRDLESASRILCSPTLEGYASANLFCGRSLAIAGSSAYDTDRAKQKLKLARVQGATLSKQDHELLNSR